MDPTRRLAVSLALLLGLAPASAARAESLRLVPRHQAGDTYLLQLEQAIDTDATAQGYESRVAGSRLRIRYQAAVLVLEVDEEGRSIRERHGNVSFDHEDAAGRRSLLPPGASYEVRRDRKGRLRLDAGETRLAPRAERLVRGVLTEQFGDSVLPKLLDPRRPVVTGESWTLDAAGVRTLLRARGLRALAFDETPRAWLERDSEGAITLRYVIAVDWIEPAEMPPDARPARSQGRLEGEIRLAPDPRDHRHVSSLSLDLQGSVVKPGVVRAYPWRLASVSTMAERTQRVPARLASSR